MKRVQKLTMILGLVLGLSAYADDIAEQAYITSYRGRTDIPVPVAVVAPQLQPVYAGRVVNVALTVDETGSPRDITVLNTVDHRLVTAVSTAMEQWRFAPAQRDGRAVAMKIEVPLNIISETAPLIVASN